MKKIQFKASGKFILIFVSTALLIFFVAMYAPSRLTTEFDDAYMYCRYASNYLEGNGFSWNVSDGPAYGATSPIFLFLITLLKSTFPHITNSFLLSLVSFCIGIMGLFILVLSGFKLGKSLAKSYIPFLVIPICILSSSFRFHSFTGMETTFSFLSNSLLILSLVIYGKKQNSVHFILLLLASIFTLQVRPDNGIYALLLPVFYLLSVQRINTKKVMVYVLYFFVSLFLLFLVYASLFGSPLPVPFYSKSGDFFIGYAGRANWNSISYLLRFVKDAFPFVVVLVVFARKRKIITLLSIIMPVIITFIYYSTTIQIMGWFARYYFPSIPFIAFAAFVALEDWLSTKYLLTKKVLVQKGMVLILISILLYLTPLREHIENRWFKPSSGVELYLPETILLTSNQPLLEVIPWWTSIQCISAIVSDLPPGLRIAATEYGYIASENLHCDVIDMAGLHNRELVSSGFSSNLILSGYPDFIWMPHTDYTFFRKCLLDDEDFHEQYSYFPGVFNYGIALRLNSSYYSEMWAVTDSVFSQAYSDKKLLDYLASISNEDREMETDTAIPTPCRHSNISSPEMTVMKLVQYP